MVYAPGWTPLEWAIDLKQNITLEVWNDQEIAYHIQKKILRFLNDFRENLLKNPQVAPDIYMRDFVSLLDVSGFEPLDSSVVTSEALFRASPLARTS